MAESAIRNKAKTLICLNRDSSSAKKGAEGLQGIKAEYKSPTEIKAVTCDMQDLEGVKKAAAEVKSMTSKDGLDVLVLNSGIMDQGYPYQGAFVQYHIHSWEISHDMLSQDGFDVQMQTNQLSHFLLTSIVWPSLKTAADKRGDVRVVTHSSSARDQPSTDIKPDFFKKCDEGTLGGDKTWILVEFTGLRWGPWQRYHQSKLANACFSMELHRKLQAKGISTIKSMTADPGLATSNLQVTSTRDGLMPHWMARMLAGGGHSAADGSLSCAMGAFSPEANSGDMYMPSESLKGPPMKCISGGEPVKKGYIYDGESLTCKPGNGANVWKYCEEALGIKFDL